jgi:hypothetical protein
MDILPLEDAAVSPLELVYYQRKGATERRKTKKIIHAGMLLHQR